MKNIATLTSPFCLFFCLLLASAQAQISQGGLPYTHMHKVPIGASAPWLETETRVLAAPNVDALLAEDEANDALGKAYRVGANLPVSLSSSNAGSWFSLVDGGQLWRLHIEAEGAEALGVYYENVVLPEGSVFYLYNRNERHIIGGYTHETPVFFATEMVEGDRITLEYHAPAGTSELPEIALSHVVYFYRGVEGHIAGFRDANNSEQIMADFCQVDVACQPEITGWEAQRDAVVHYSFQEGPFTYVCSGALINNTAEDCTPYLLTANHCGEVTSNGQLNNHVWYFKYQRPTCAPGVTTPYPLPSSTMTGGIFRASSKLGTHSPANGFQLYGTDFTLVQLNTAVPISYDPYFAGWSRAVSASPSGTGIHHPAGHEKKISTYTASLTSAAYNGGLANAHWVVTWAATTNGHGVTEGGSSGSPIFNNNGFILGILSGGLSSCTSTSSPDLYGKFSVSWNSIGTAASSRLQDWLDPLGTNPTTLGGTYAPCTEQAPEAEFTASTTTISVGGTVAFTDQSTANPTTWLWAVSPGTAGTEWQFTAGTTTGSQNPQITFLSAGNYTVSLTASNPAGSDTETKPNYISVVETGVYCEATSTNCDEYIEQVLFNTISNFSGCGNYEDFTDISTNLLQGSTYTLQIITVADDGQFFGYLDDQVAVWIDWNQDGDFNDAGELVFLEVFSASSEFPLTTTVTVPANAIQGSTRMRVRMVYQPVDGPIEPCGTSQWGEVEDYTVAIAPAETDLTLSNIPGNLTIPCTASTDPSNTGQLTASTTCTTNNGAVNISFTDKVVPGSCAQSFTLMRTFTAADGCGNTATHIQQISVLDNVAPQINCGITEDLVEVTSFPVLVSNYIALATAADACAPGVLVSQNPLPNTVWSQAGTFQVTLQAADPCGNVAQCTIAVEVSDVSSVESASSQQFQVFPNPSTGVFMVLLEAVNAPYQVVIHDVTGKSVMQKTIPAGTTQFELDMSGFASGIYLARFNLEEGIITRRLIIQ